jgi:uncharacterized protein (TIGR02453 family)
MSISPIDHRLLVYGGVLLGHADSSRSPPVFSLRTIFDKQLWPRGRRVSPHYSDVVPSIPSPRFEGFSGGAIDFYRRLEADNTKTFWAEHKAEYENDLRAPMEALAGELEHDFGQFKIFRPYRDVRFSKDKTPYKTHIGAVTEGEGGEFYYLQVSAEGLFVASGYYQMAKDQLDRFRRAVDNGVSGEDLVRRLKALQRRYEFHGKELTTAPRGYPRDHPRLWLLQHKGLTAQRTVGTPKWLHSRQAMSRIAEIWRGAEPMNEWLNRHVGPSTLAPDDAP